MGKWLVLAGVALTVGCNYGAGAFRCTDDNQCGAGGTCELDNLCSSPSSTCPSGRVYSDLSGVLSGQCVSGIPLGTDGGGELPIDASVDAPPEIPPDATACFGTGLVRVCLVTPPTQPLTIADFTIINTNDNATCAPLLPGSTGGDYCVVAATTITINNDLRATGTRPLVLLATDTITSTTDNLIDVGSHRAPPQGTPELGAGADPTSCNAGMGPTNGGGGAGGSFAGIGGTGGNGNSSGAGRGTPALAVNPITELRGGCPGQTGAGGGNAGAAGHGGGAVYLIAGTKIEIAGGINAGGEGGAAGIRNTSGGGGGGAGGMIGFDAPVITVTSLLVANGGGGAEGSGQNNTLGDVGDDATAATAAAGGAGNTNNGGDGGAGSSGVAAGPGAPAGNGTGGGGGGGGGAGLIKAPVTATLSGPVSPLAIP